jgi:hypothetical protein
MLKLLINSGQGPVDYTRYLIDSTVDIEDSINTPSLLSFTLSNVDGAFVPPIRSAYVELISTTSPLSATGAIIMTGYITNMPEHKFLGQSQRAGQMYPAYALTKTRFQHFEVDVKVTSDEYLLNMKAVPFIAAYVNQTMGDILTNIASTLAPGFFDLSGIQDGDLVPFFAYDPTSKWSDVAKEFADQAQYRYSAINRKITFAPYGDAPLGIIYDEANQRQTQFNPTALQTGVLAVPLVNDAIVVGDVEPQQNRDDYFCGDGFTGNFPLKYTIFHGATNLLLQEDWTEQQINTSLWNFQDLLGQFVLAGALNAVSNVGNAATALGQDYILAQSGVELGGTVMIQHGEFQFNDVSVGLVGGLYADESNLVAASCVAGFDIRTAPGQTVSLTASGANGIQICPIISGVLVGTPVVTVQNHHYILQTQVSARMPIRYNQIYRTLAGSPFGDEELPSQAEVTLTITDIDLGAAYNTAALNNPFIPAYTPIITKYTSTGQSVPSFAGYALLNSISLNLTVNYTLIAQPPQGLLQVKGLTGAQPTNALALTGGQMPPFDVTDPLALQIGAELGPEIHYAMGFGISQDLVATIAHVGDYDQLEFYSPLEIPGVGARVRLQAWQAGTAVSRIQDPVSIASEAALVGDNGLRSAIVTDLKPAPRTSYDCDLAGAAYIDDRELPQYDGSYTVESLFWDNTKDYPRSGRFLTVTAPQRNISGQNFLVRSVKTSILDSRSEILQFEISFGQDLYLEKQLRRFIAQPTGTTGLLQANDTAVAPNPQNLPPPSTAFTTYLDNMTNARLFQVTGTRVLFDLGAPLTSFGATAIEIRRSDTGWNTNNQNLIVRMTTQQFFLPRASYDQTWYMRLVNATQTSRFSRVFRVNYPMVPQPPSQVVVSPGAALDGFLTTNPVVTVSLPTSFDRNIYGLQLDTGNMNLVPCQNLILFSDNPVDIGFVDVMGVDPNGLPIDETVELNGTTPVATINTFCKVSIAERNPQTVVLVNDPNGTTWLIYVLDSGQLQARLSNQLRTPAPIYLLDSDTGTTSWQIGVSTVGDVTTTEVPFVTQITGFQLISDGDITFTVQVHNNGDLFTV